ncbi:multidrug efflux MATE transporter CdeA [Gottschalkiaceae bacterium SANA]|nr:multidrug efflux MATE transporter CdeA [Gottschalkiaceae bacterium SANA]
MQEKILGTEKISKLFIKFAIPAIIGMVISSMQTIIDGIFVGRFVGENALASVNVARPFMDLIFGPTFIISIGAMSYMGRALGAKQVEKGQSIFRTATLLGVSLGLFIALIGTTFHRQLAELLGASPLLLNFVSTYIKNIALFAPFIITMYLFGFTNRLLGKPRVYLISSICSIIVNISLDYLFVKELQMGIQGAALATGIAFVVAFVICAIPLLDKRSTVNFYKGHWTPSLIGQMLYNGSSEGIVSLSSALTVYLFNRTFMAFAGESGVAAYTTISYIAYFGLMMVFGISDGIASIISYNYGKRQFDRIKEIMKLALRTSAIIGLVLVAVMNFSAEPLIQLFIKDNSSIVAMAAKGAALYSVGFLITGYNIISSSYFTAIGNARASIFIALSRGLVGITLGILILPNFLGINGVWLTVPLAELLAFILIQFLKKREPTATLTLKQIDQYSAKKTA